MKKVKLIISLLAIAICLMLNSEMYAVHLTNLDYDSYSFTFKDDEAYMEKRNNILNGIEKLCEQENVGVFVIVKKNRGSMDTNMTIYADATARNTLEKRGIEEGSRKSFFSGSVEINIKLLSDAVTLDRCPTFRLIGDSGAVKKVYDTIANDLELSTLSYEGMKEKTRNLILFWAMAGGAILLFTIFDIVFQKKECFVRVAMGTSVWRIIGMNVLIDAIALAFEFLLLSVTLSGFAYVWYKYEYALIIMAAVIVGNSILYLSMLSIDVKKALSNTPVGKGLLSLCYVFRSATIIILMSFLAVNLSAMADTFKYLSENKIIERFNDRSFIEMHWYPEAYDKAFPDNTNTFLDNMHKKELQIIKENYRSRECAIDFLAMHSDTHSHIIINKAAGSVLEGISGFNPGDIDNTILVLIPDSDKENEESVIQNAKDTYEITLGATEQPFKAVHYGSANVLYFGNQTELHSDYAKDPIIIYTDEDIGKKVFNDEYFIASTSGYLKHLMFRADESEIEAITRQYGLTEDGLYLTAVSVTDDYEQYKAAEVKKLVLLTVVSVLLFILGLLVIGMIIRIEYTVNAMELSIRKVLGYPLDKRYAKLFISGMATYFLAFGISILMLYKNEFEVSPIYAVIAALLLIVAEIVAEMMHIIRAEKAQIVKVLKGGSL